MKFCLDFGYYDKRVIETYRASLSVDIQFQFSRVNTQKWNCQLIGQRYVETGNNCPSWLSNSSSHQHCVRALTVLHIHQHLVMLIFLILAISVCVQWCLTVVFICIFLTINDVRNDSICLLAIPFGSFNYFQFLQEFYY